MFRYRICQLNGGGLDGTGEFWVEPQWCGLTVARAWFWLKNMGWGMYTGWTRVESLTFAFGKRMVTLPARERQVLCCAPLRLRLRGRCWIEDTAKPATRVVGSFQHIDAEKREQARSQAELDWHRKRLPVARLCGFRGRRRRKVSA